MLDYLGCMWPTRDRILHFLSATGNLASILTVSRVIPRKERQVVGPCTFSSASGTPKESQICFTASSCCWHTLDVGSPRMRKYEAKGKCPAASLSRP